MTSYALGKHGEKTVLQALINRGYLMVETAQFRHCGDMELYTRTKKLKIEVKTARANKRGEYRFCLWKNDKYGRTQISCSDIVILQCIDHLGLITYFIIPAYLLKTQKHITLTANSKKYAQFRTPLSAYNF